MCFWTVFLILLQSWQCKVSFSLLVVARAIASTNEFKVNWGVLTMSGRGLCKCCIILVAQQDGIHKLSIKMSRFTVAIIVTPPADS